MKNVKKYKLPEIKVIKISSHLMWETASTSENGEADSLTVEFEEETKVEE